MPFTKLHVPQSLNSNACRDLALCLHDSLVEICGVHPNDDFCLICRYADEDRLIEPEFLGPRDPLKTVIAEVTLLAGRTPDTKEALYRDFGDRIEARGFERRNAVIFLVENSRIDWSFGLLGSLLSAPPPDGRDGVVETARS